MNAIDNLTIGQYQELYAIGKSEADEADKAIESVSVLTGKTTKEIEEMPMAEFQLLSRAVVIAFEKAKLKTSPSAYLKSGKKYYQINYVVQSLRHGQFVELQHWLKGDLIENMHNILASISMPVKKFLWLKLPGKNDSSKHKQIAEEFKDVSFNEAYGCIVFFCKIFAVSINSLQGYLKLQMIGKMEETKLNQLMTDLTHVMDGFITPNELQTLKT